MTTTTRKPKHQISINPKVFDDWELLEDMARLQENPNDALLVLRISRTILGTQYEQAKNECRNDEGRVSAERMAQLLVTLFEEQAPKAL